MKCCLFFVRRACRRVLFGQPSMLGRIGGVMLVVWLAVGGMSKAGAEDGVNDLIIRNGTVVDGSGAPGRVADVAVREGRIVAIGKVEGVARREINVGGLVVAPGFIDVHSHADRNLVRLPLAENYLRMGVTTIVTGNCGASPVDLPPFFEEIEKTGISVNVGVLVGHNSIRKKAMGGSFMREPSPEELGSMKRMLDESMKAGALGLSTGLIYVPGTYARTEEVVELAKVAAVNGGIYCSHMRNESTGISGALEEVFHVAREAGIPVQISHIKLWGGSSWGRAKEVLGQIHRARAEGIKVTQDEYVYTAASTGVSACVPSWVREGGIDGYREKIRDPEKKARVVEDMKTTLKVEGFPDYEYVVIAYYRENPKLNGLSIKQAAVELRGSDSLDAQIETILEIHEKGGADGVYHAMNEDDLAVFLKDPDTMIASDSSVRRVGFAMPHPRGIGNNARVLARYVRERGDLTLEDAVRRMTSLPAGVFQLKDRGELRPGAWADIAIFDPERVADHATFEKPHEYSTGFRHVFVNGVEVIGADRHLGVRPGKILKRASD